MFPNAGAGRASREQGGKQMKFSIRLLVPTLAVVLAAAGAALLFSPSAQAQQLATCNTGQICVTGVAFTSTGPYMVGDAIKVTFTFTDEIIANDVNAPGTSTIDLQVFDPSNDGDDTTLPGTTTRNFFAPIPTAATNKLVFAYTVKTTDPDEGVVTVNQNALALGPTDNTAPDNRGNIADADTGQVGTLVYGHNRVSAYGQPNHVIDKTPPTAPSVGVTTASGIGETGGTITVTAAYNEAVKVSGAPSLPFKIGDDDRSASYSPHSGKNVTFTYTTQKGDNGALTVPDGSITGGTITDLAGNVAPLAFTGATIGDHNVMTDDAAPSVTYKGPSSLTVGQRIRTIVPITSDTDIKSYKLVDGSRLPATLRLDETTGYITGRPTRAVARATTVTIEVCDGALNAAGDPDPNCADVTLKLPAIIDEEADSPAPEPSLPEVSDIDLSGVTVGDAAPSRGLLLALTAAGGALLLGGVGLAAARRRAPISIFPRRRGKR